MNSSIGPVVVLAPSVTHSIENLLQNVLSYIVNS